MGQHVDIREGDRASHIALAVKAIRDGYIFAGPLEHGYAFFVDAFSHDGVRAMHALRQDPLFTASQVMVSDASVVKGLVREVNEHVEALMERFWPGLLSLNLRPQSGLGWDLGDNKELDRISIRVPDQDFIRDVLKETGPLAVASAVYNGRPPIQSTFMINALDSDLALTFDIGDIEQGPRSTIVEADSSGIRLVREGALTLSALAEVAPSITAP